MILGTNKNIVCYELKRRKNDLGKCLWVGVSSCIAFHIAPTQSLRTIETSNVV